MRNKTALITVSATVLYVSLLTVSPTLGITTAMFRFDSETDNGDDTFTYTEDIGGVDFLMVLSQNEIDGELKNAELSDNVPPFAPTDSMSMFYHGAHEILTIDVVTAAFNPNPNPGANFGQRTVEFWYKSHNAWSVDEILTYNDTHAFGKTSAWDIHQTHAWNPIHGTQNGVFGLRQWYWGTNPDNPDQFVAAAKRTRSFDPPGNDPFNPAGDGMVIPEDEGGVFLTTTDASQFDPALNGLSAPLPDGGWSHLAFTVDLPNNDARTYINGIEVTTEFVGGTFEGIDFDFSASNLPVSLGRDSSGNFGGGGLGFLIDDLRFSDMVLSPGDGCGGPGVMAWNTSLSPGAVCGQVVGPGTGSGPLPGDANNDDLVTGADLISVQQNFGTAYPSDPSCDGMGLGDANSDCLVTGADLITVQQNFGNVAGGQDAALPEPATAILILFGLSSCIQRRHELGR